LRIINVIKLLLSYKVNYLSVHQKLMERKMKKNHNHSSFFIPHPIRYPFLGIA